MPFVAIPAHSPLADPHPASDQILLSTLSENPHSFLQPAPTLHTASLVLAKRFLDPLVSSVREIQENQLQEARKKRKRADADQLDTHDRLRVKQVHLQGFDLQQIWGQARRVLDASQRELKRTIHHTALLASGRKEEKPQGPAQAKAKHVSFIDDETQGTATDEPEINGHVQHTNIVFNSAASTT